MTMTPKPNVPTPLLVLVGAVLVILLITSAATGQWAILLLGVVAIVAMAVPYRNRS